MVICNRNKFTITALFSIAFLLLNCSHSKLQDLKQKYSAKSINYFYEIAFFQDYVGKMHVINKWNEDIYMYVDGNFSTNDMTYIKNTISQLSSLQLPINLYLTSDSLLANLFIYFGDYSYLEEKIGFNNKDYEPFVGVGIITEKRSYIKSAVVGFANNATRYSRPNVLDSIKLRQAIIMEELTQSLGLIGDSWQYPNSIFFEGGVCESTPNDIDKDVIRFLYEHSIPAEYPRQQFEKDFGDVLYHINASQKIADYVSTNNIPFHFLEYIREKCFHNNILVKCPSKIYIRLQGNFSPEDSDLCKNAVSLFNTVSNQFQLVFEETDIERIPCINIYYKSDDKRINTIIERQITTSNMMFPRRLNGEIKITYWKQDLQENNRFIFNALYKLLGADNNNYDDIMEFDSLGNFSFKPGYKELLELIYEPVFYSGLTLKEFDEALEILKAKGDNNE